MEKREYGPDERRLTAAEHAFFPEVPGQNDALINDRIKHSDTVGDKEPTRKPRKLNALYALTDGVLFRDEHVDKLIQKYDERRSKKAKVGRHAVDNAITEVIPVIKPETPEQSEINDIKVPTLEDLRNLTLVEADGWKKEQTVEFPVINSDKADRVGRHDYNNMNDATVTFPKIPKDDHDSARR